MSVQPLIAALDLSLVRLIRAAVAANGLNVSPRPGPSAGQAAGRGHVLLPPLKFRPDPVFLPRPVHRPEPHIEPACVAMVVTPPTPTRVTGPLPAPWQMVLRERPIIPVPPVAAPGVAAYAAAATPGRFIDAVV